MLRSSCRRLTPLLTLLVGTACSGNPDRPALVPTEPSAERGGLPHADGRAALAAVRAGNEQSILASPTLRPPGVPVAPFIEARLYAIANVAMHDALNGVTPRYARYTDNGPVDRNASAAAAVLTAAHDAIAGAAPGAAGAVNTWYASAIGALAGDEGLSRGITIGHRAAAAILARRAADGVAAGGVAPYHPGTNPGDYRFTVPFNGPPFDLIFPGTGGFADASNWAATVTPFVIRSASQFRAPRPYGSATNAAAVKTPRYTADFVEVKALGCFACDARSETQRQIALFWMENSPTGWNRVARNVADLGHLDAVETARLFALVQMGEFDAYTASLESKYYYNFWRPVSAVALAGTDDNPSTSPAAGWQVLAFPTPPVPDYPSAHSTAGGTAAAIMEAVVSGRGRFATTSGSLAGVMRSFASVAEAARENADSRVFIGYHFRHATDVGLAQGRAVGRYVTAHALRPLEDDDH
jgi:hypothetical protein